MTAEHEVVVIGAGMAGLAAARALARDGRNVLVLEQFQLGHSGGSSHGSSRIVRLSHDDPDDVLRAERAYELWRELEEESGEALLELTGGLDLWDDLAGHEAALSASGVRYELLDAAEIERRFPVRAPERVTGLFQPEGGIVLAGRALRAFAASARAHGATICERSPVRAIQVNEQSVVVETDVDRLTARSVVVAAGAWARRLLSPLGIDLPVEETVETIAYFRLLRESPMPIVIETTAAVHEGYALPAPGHGVKAGIHRSGSPVDPDELSTPDPDIVARISTWIDERFPDIDPAPIHTDTCLYTSTADERFLLERHGRVVVGSACSGRGFKFAPHTGRVLADLATEVL